MHTISNRTTLSRCIPPAAKTKSFVLLESVREFVILSFANLHLPFRRSSRNIQQWLLSVWMIDSSPKTTCPRADRCTVFGCKRTDSIQVQTTSLLLGHINLHAISFQIFRDDGFCSQHYPPTGSFPRLIGQSLIFVPGTEPPTALVSGPRF